MPKIKRLTKSQKALVKAAIRGGDFDYGYLLELEKIKLQNMYNYFSLSQLTDDWKRVCSQIKICINLLDIILKEEYNKYVNIKNYHRFIKATNLQDPKRVDFLDLWKRFPDDLAILKAEHLYYKMRYYYTKNWWD